MKVLLASIALLGLPAALAAVAATPLNASPTRPDAALGVPAASPEPTALSRHLEKSQQEINEGRSSDEQKQQEQAQKGFWHDLLRRAAAASPPVHNTFTHVNKTTTSTSTITSAPAGTEVAVFTAAGAVFTVTEISGTDAVDGKTLVPGAPAQLIGGEYISEASSGIVVVNGQTLSFTPFSSSSVPSQPPAASSSQPPAGSSSGSGAAATTSTSPGAAPVKTAAANVVALMGAVVGAMVL